VNWEKWNRELPLEGSISGVELREDVRGQVLGRIKIHWLTWQENASMAETEKAFGRRHDDGDSAGVRRVKPGNRRVGEAELL